MALISDVKNEIERGRTVAKTASFLCPDEDKVRETVKELGWLRRQASGATLAFALGLKEKPRAEAGEI
jgi:hypothetical protein